MTKLLEVWLMILERETWGHYHNRAYEDLEIFRENYEKGGSPSNPIHLILMRAFTHSLAHDLPVPAWVINALDADIRFQKYRPFPKGTGMKWLTHREVMSQWGIDQNQDGELKLARYIWNDNLGYYVILGKWMSEVAQTVRRMEITTYRGNRVHLIADGWTWVDDGEITYDKIVENLGDLAFSMEDVVEFEKSHSFKKLSSPMPLSLGEEEPKAQNVFRKTDSGWEIVFNGKSYGTFDLEGCEYLHCYFKNSPQELTGVNIDNEINAGKRMPIEDDNFDFDFQREEDGNLKLVGFCSGGIKKIITKDKKIDGNWKWSKMLRSEVSRLNAEIKKGVNRVEGEEKIKAIENYILEDGEYFQDELSRINDSVRKAVERLVKELQRRGAEEFIKHLDDSFGPKYKGKSALLGIKAKGYKPNPPIKWNLE